MERSNGPWKIKASACRYKDDFMEVIQDNVIRPDGKPGTYGTVRMKPGVAVLPLDPGNQAYYTRQFRYAIGRESIEVVCGGVDAPESPLEAAKREVHEELGIEAEEWMDLGQFDLDTSMVNNPVNLFICRRLHFSQPETEGSETIRPVKTSFEEMVQMVMDGRITHGPSCVLILKAHLYMQEHPNLMPGPGAERSR